MVRYSRRTYASMASASDRTSPGTRGYLLGLLHYLLYVVFLRQKATFAVTICIALLVGAVYLFIYLTNNIERRLNLKYTAKIATIQAEVETLRSENEVLANLRADFMMEVKGATNTSSGLKDDSSASHWNPLEAPGLALGDYAHFDYYSLRSRLERGVTDAWDFANNFLSNTEAIQQRYWVYEWRRMMHSYLEALGKRDYFWRNEKQSRLASRIRGKLVALQESSSCPRQYLKCDLKTRCGLGCVIHHLAYCLIAGLALNRTLLLQEPTYAYTVAQPSDRQLLPLNHSLRSLTGSPDCLPDAPLRKTVSFNQAMAYNVTLDGYHIVELFQIEFTLNDPFRPLAVPSQLADELGHLTQQPFALFVGHLVDYILRPNERFEERLRLYKWGLELAGTEPIVGVHVRRTDKSVEAAIYEFDWYMSKVGEFYDLLDTQLALSGAPQNRSKTQRKVYLATDDPGLWSREVPMYSEKGYTFYGNVTHASNAANPAARYTPDGLEQTLLDLWMLSTADYLVCTFSSQFCRLAYELLQVRAPKGRDMSLRAYSLDEVYYFGGQRDHNLVALVGHDPPIKGPDTYLPEHSFKRGDHLGVARDARNGYYRGDLKPASGHNGSASLLNFPKYKVTEQVVAVPFRAFDP